MRPDLSPEMLQSFLRIRADYLVLTGMYATPKASALRAAKEQLRQLSGVTKAEFKEAWMGRLEEPEPRVKLWVALDVSPHLLGIRLTHGGQEDVCAEPPAGIEPDSEVPG